MRAHVPKHSAFSWLATSALAFGCGGPSNRPGPHDALERRVSALEAEVRALRQRAPAGVTAHAPDPSAESPRTSPPEQLSARFQAEQRDPNWAPLAERGFRAELDRIRERSGFTVKSIQCRKTLCALVLEWPNSSDAEQGLGDIMHGELGQGCLRTGGISGPPSTPHRETVWFDCSSR